MEFYTLERLSQFIQKTDSCWLWTGRVNDEGYARVGHKSTGVHRRMWKLVNGPIPGGLCVLHSCDNRRCVNPAHLFLGTRLDNNADRVKKGRNGVASRHNAKLTDEQVLAIREEDREENGFIRRIAAKYGVSETAVSNILYGRTYKHIPWV